MSHPGSHLWAASSNSPAVATSGTKPTALASPVPTDRSPSLGPIPAAAARRCAASLPTRKRGHALCRHDRRGRGQRRRWWLASRRAGRRDASGVIRQRGARDPAGSMARGDISPADHGRSGSHPRSAARTLGGSSWAGATAPQLRFHNPLGTGAGSETRGEPRSGHNRNVGSAGRVRGPYGRADWSGVASRRPYKRASVDDRFRVWNDFETHERIGDMGDAPIRAAGVTADDRLRAQGRYAATAPALFRLGRSSRAGDVSAVLLLADAELRAGAHHDLSHAGACYGQETGSSESDQL